MLELLKMISDEDDGKFCFNNVEFDNAEDAFVMLHVIGLN